MPLDDIIFQSPLKRKALKATPTICRFCETKFIDKYYKGETKHTVRCTRCNRVNAELDASEYTQKIWEQGFRHDIGTYGSLGGIHRTKGKFRDMIKDAFKLQTEEEVDKKLKEFEYNVRMEQYRIQLEEERKKRMIQMKKDKAKIRVVHKGEKEYEL